MSLGTRLLNVFAAPGEVFDALKPAPSATANWLVPAILFIIISWLSAGLIFSQASIKQQLSDITDQAIQKQVDKGRLSEAQAEQAREVGAKYGAIGSRIGAVAVPVFIGFASPFCWGLIVWLVGAKALKGNFPYLKAVELVGLTNMIGVLDVIVKTLLIVALGNLYAAPSLALAVKGFDPQNTVHAVLAVVNLMTFWLLLVRSIGLARLSGVSAGKAAAWVYGIWALYTGVLIGIGAAVKAAFGG
jgi:hypothetical protein